MDLRKVCLHFLWNFGLSIIFFESNNFMKRFCLKRIYSVLRGTDVYNFVLLTLKTTTTARCHLRLSFNAQHFGGSSVRQESSSVASHLVELCSVFFLFTTTEKATFTTIVYPHACMYVCMNISLGYWGTLWLSCVSASVAACAYGYPLDIYSTETLEVRAYDCVQRTYDRPTINTKKYSWLLFLVCSYSLPFVCHLYSHCICMLFCRCSFFFIHTGFVIISDECFIYLDLFTNSRLSMQKRG